LALLAREDLIDVEAILPLLVQDPAAPVAGEGGANGHSNGHDIAGAVAQWLTVTRPASGTIYDSAMAAFERPLFAEVLRETAGNQLRAAQALGINRNTLRKRLGELSLDPEEFTRRP
jgi:two-component system nitrogen regulation response regulator GlnG